MRCVDAMRLKTTALAGEASDDQQELLRSHAAECPRCAQEWSALDALAGALRAQAPPVFEGGRNPLEALGRERVWHERLARAAVAHRRDADATRARRGTAWRLVRWALAPAVLLLACGGLLLHRSPGPSDALAAVEAATQAQPTHTVMRDYDDTTGKLMQTFDGWTATNGDRYWSSLVHPTGVRTTNLYRYRQNVVWEHIEGQHKYELHWVTNNAFHGVKATRNPLRNTLARLRSYDVGLRVSERRGRLDGHAVRIVDIAVRGRGGGPAPALRGHTLVPSMVTCYLSADGSRLLRYIDKVTIPSVRVDRSDTYPIEYDVQPPARLFTLDLPLDAKVYYGSFGTRGARIDPIWERWSESQKRRVYLAVRDLARAWAAGDIEAFARRFDLQASVAYSVPETGAAGDPKAHWTDLLAHEKGRWRSYDLTLEYAFGVSPELTTGKLQWPYRRPDVQIREPGVVVLARVQATDQGGKAQSEATMMVLHEVAGEYRAVLWNPPFGKPATALERPAAGEATGHRAGPT